MLPSLLQRGGGRRFLLRAASSSVSSEHRTIVLRRAHHHQFAVTRQVPAAAATGSSSSSNAMVSRRFFATQPKEKETAEEHPTMSEEQAKPREEEQSLRDTVNRLKQEQQQQGSSKEETTQKTKQSSSSEKLAFDDIFRQAADQWDSFTIAVGETWQELLQSGKRKTIIKKIHPQLTPEGDQPYTGPVDIMVIDPSENLTAWERMQKRLTEAPIIQDMLSRTEEIYETSGAKKVKERVDDLKQDAQEAWDTSQNPWVYRISSVYDTLTAETAESVAVKELRKLDPEFTLEDWRQDVVEHDLPQIMQWFLEGRINQLKPWLGESVFKRIAAEITARKQEGVEIDTHVLGIMNSEILACEPDEVNKGSPIILLHFMVQQINCTRKKADGAIVEGSEDDIRANSYVAAFQREYNEETGELNWKIVDFRFNGAIAYL